MLVKVVSFKMIYRELPSSITGGLYVCMSTGCVCPLCVHVCVSCVCVCCACTSPVWVCPMCDCVQVECVGSVSDGLLFMAWSPDQELVVLVTATSNLLLMTREFDPLTETPLHPQEFGEGIGPVCVCVHPSSSLSLQPSQLLWGGGRRRHSSMAPWGSQWLTSRWSRYERGEAVVMTLAVYPTQPAHSTCLSMG